MVTNGIVPHSPTDVNGGGNAVLESAQGYAEMGLRVLPLVKNEKHPACKNGVKDASNDVETINNWWAKNPDWNLGIAGGNGLIIIDIDVKDGKNGVTDINRIFADAGEPSPIDSGSCPMVKTPSGGYHLFYRCEHVSDYKNGVGIAYQGKNTAIDIRADNGYVVAAPSTISTGDNEAAYQWVRRLVPIAELPELPACLANVLPKQGDKSQPLLTEKPQQATQERSLASVNTDVSSDINHRILRYLDRVDAAVAGQGGHDTTIRVLGRLQHGFDLSQCELQPYAEYYNQTKCEPPWSEEELKHKVEDAVNKWEPSDGSQRGHLLTDNTALTGQRGGNNTRFHDEIQTPVDKEMAKALLAADAVAEQVPSRLIQEFSEDFPQELLNVPGFISDYMGVYKQYADYYNPLFGLNGAMAMVAFMASRRIRWGKTTTPFLGLMVAPSGSGKNATQQINRYIMNRAGLTDYYFGDITSNGSVESMLAKRKKVFINVDEADTMVGTFAKGETWEKKISNVLKTVYTCGDTSYTCRTKADYIGTGKTDVVYKPGLVCTLSATPDKTFANIENSMVTDGLIPRLTMFEVKKSTPIYEESWGMDDIDTTDLVKAVRFWKNPHFERDFYYESKKSNPKDLGLFNQSDYGNKTTTQIWEESDSRFYTKKDNEGDNESGQHNPEEILSADNPPKPAIAALMNNRDKIEDCNMDTAGVDPNRPPFEPYNQSMDFQFVEPERIEMYCVPVEVGVNDVMMNFRKWVDGDKRCSGNEVSDAIWTRAYEKARTLALIYAVSENRYYPTITVAGAKWAIAVSKWCTEYTANRIMNTTCENAEDGNRKKIIDIINKNSIKDPKADGWARRSVITEQACMKKKDFGDLLDNMVDANILETAWWKCNGSRKKSQFFRVRRSVTQ